MTIPARTIYGVCGVCACMAGGFGFSPSDRHRPIWACDDPDCLTIARSTYNMRQIEWNGIETEAIRQAGSSAGEFLEKLGKFNLVELTEHEWGDFCRHMVASYRSQLAFLVASHQSKLNGKSSAPF